MDVNTAYASTGVRRVRELRHAIVDGARTVTAGAGELVRPATIWAAVYEFLALARGANSDDLAAVMTPHENASPG
jgi:hypothetical protein